MYVKELGSAVIDRVISIPFDLAYRVRSTFEDVAGSKFIKEQNRTERQRIWQVINKAFNIGSFEIRSISKIVRIVLTNFYDLLPDSTLEAIAKKVGLSTSYITRRVSTQIALTTLVVRKLAKEIQRNSRKYSK